MIKVKALVTEIRRLNVAPGEILLFHVPPQLGRADVEDMGRQIRQQFPELRFMVLPAAITTEVVRQS